MAYKIKCKTEEFCVLVQKVCAERGIFWVDGAKLRKEPLGCWVYIRYHRGKYVMSRRDLDDGQDHSALTVPISRLPKSAQG